MEIGGRGSQRMCVVQRVYPTPTPAQGHSCGCTRVRFNVRARWRRESPTAVLLSNLCPTAQRLRQLGTGTDASDHQRRRTRDAGPTTTRTPPQVRWAPASRRGGSTAQTGMLHDAAAIVQRARADPPVPTFEPTPAPVGGRPPSTRTGCRRWHRWQIFTHAASIRHDLTALIEPVRRLRCVRQAAASSSQGISHLVEGSTGWTRQRGSEGGHLLEPLSEAPMRMPVRRRKLACGGDGLSGAHRRPA